ncbi:tetratricopeptide repeat protein [Treponema brennaborense]|uniref:Tetratricopeptide TPR_1 repeat-containing protein n=1 Tax=Treponema brennaborense (strain DSM 12168 / CIP 105900 / DD5/3) TaxID=906968 RepID=F4LJ48_TREBD|nr:tetratricopeptide repeat protein [Treponema brennaborense]AEE16305.1 Tetratricopeptide TPR_1 repeat-containing protein [Treponema brennaborense DSM 12168]
MKSFFRSRAAAACSAVLCCFTVSCVSTSGNRNGSGVITENAPEIASVPLAVPERVERSYFSFEDATIMQDMEIGSPASLRSAVAKIRKSAPDYSDPEKVLLGIASSLMSVVWPSEKVSWNIPEVGFSNPYTGAINSAGIGIYDSSTGNSDFFTLVLPSLVLLSASSNGDYYAESQTALTAALEMNPRSVLVRYLLGCLYRKMHNTSSAAEMFQSAVRLDPSCYETSYAYARAVFDTGAAAAAYTEAQALLAQYPKNLQVLKLCAEASFALKRYAEADQYITQVLQQEPDNAAYLLFRARILVETGDFIKASSLLDVYARTDKTAKWYLLLRARIQKDWNKNTAASVATIEDALKRYPADLDVILFAAELAAVTGGTVDGKTAGQLAAVILAAEPDNSAALVICISDAMRHKDWKNAYGLSSSLLRSGVSETAVLLNHIRICLELDFLAEAQTVCAELYAKEPTDDEVRQSYIRVLAAQGKSAEVSSLIETLLPSASAKLKSFLYYQRSLLAANDAAKLADLRLSLTANPRNQEPLYELYRYYYGKADYRKAQYYLKQVVALNPDDADLIRLNGELEKLLLK